MSRFINAKKGPWCAGTGCEGFNLVEVSAALGIVVFVLTVLIGLSDVALRMSGESAKNIEAANAASQIVTQWRSILKWNSQKEINSVVAQPVDFPVPVTVPEVGQSLSGSDIQVDGEGKTVSGNWKFRMDYEIERPATRSGMVRIHLRLNWPPSANGTSKARGGYELVSGVLLDPA